MRNFDIYWVRFEYEDRDGYKVRPALILNKNILQVAKITKNLDRTESPYYIIYDWRAAGLSCPSLIRIDQTVEVQPTELGRYIGHLAERDAATLKALLDKDILEESDLKILNRFV